MHEIPAAYAIAKPYNARLAVPDQVASLPVRVSTRTAPLPQESRNPYGYRRRPSDEVRLGDLQVGGAQPVRVELATTVPLADVDGTLGQIRMLSTPAHPGAPVCEMVRLQATSGADLEAFARLRQRLPEAGLNVPLSLCLPLAPWLLAHPARGRQTHYSPGSAAARRAVARTGPTRCGPGGTPWRGA